MKVAVYVPLVEEAREHVTVAVPPAIRVMVEGHETERADEEEDVVRDIVPAKPNRLVNVSVSMLAEPALNAIDAGPAKLKSVTVTERMTEWLREPLVPVIVRLYAPAGRPAPHVGN